MTNRTICMKIMSLLLVLSILTAPASAGAAGVLAATPSYAGDLVVDSSYSLSFSYASSKRYVRLTAIEAGVYEINVRSSMYVDGALYSDPGLSSMIARGSSSGDVSKWTITAELAKGQSVYLQAYIAYPDVSTDITVETLYWGTPVTSVQVAPRTLTLDVGKSSKLSTVITPSNATNKKLTWMSSNKGIAEVDTSGNVTAVSGGTAVISALSPMGLYGQCTITVNDSQAISEATLQRAYARILYRELQEPTLAANDGYISHTDETLINLRDLCIDASYSGSLRGGAVEAYPGDVFGITTGSSSQDGFVRGIYLTRNSYAGTDLKDYGARFQELLSWVPMDGTDLEKVAAVFSYLTTNVSYDYSLIYGQLSYYRYGALCNGKAQCSGYASAFSGAMNYLGIPCVPVRSITSGVYHDWNMVQVGGDWYHIDTTNNLFLLSSKSMGASAAASACYPAVKDVSRDVTLSYRAPQPTPTVQSFSLSESKLTLRENDFKELKINSVVPQGGDWRLATFSSSNPKVAAVSTFGTVVTGTTGGKAVITCKLGNATRTADVNVEVAAPPRLSSATIASIPAATYSGKEIKPRPTVRLGGKTLREGTDYAISYSNNLYVGKATITLAGKGEYTGSITKAFTINPKGIKLAKLKGKKAGLTATWKKQNIQTTGYQLRYSTAKSFKGAKVVTVGKRSQTTKTIGKLKRNKTYYVQIRTYKTVAGERYYSGWSPLKKAKTQ